MADNWATISSMIGAWQTMGYNIINDWSMADNGLQYHQWWEDGRQWVIKLSMMEELQTMGYIINDGRIADNGLYYQWWENCRQWVILSMMGELQTMGYIINDGRIADNGLYYQWWENCRQWVILSMMGELQTMGYIINDGELQTMGYIINDGESQTMGCIINDGELQTMGDIFNDGRIADNGWHFQWWENCRQWVTLSMMGELQTMGDIFNDGRIADKHHTKLTSNLAFLRGTLGNSSSRASRVLNCGLDDAFWMAACTFWKT